MAGRAEESGTAILDSVPLPSFQPLPLERRPQPFSHPDWLYEIKYDGFRALAYLERGEVRLISRNANAFKSFPDLAAAIGQEITAKSAILDGEIVALDGNGCAQFNQLLFRRGTPRFCAFDVVYLNGRDLRTLPLVERKRALRSIMPRTSKFLLCVDHVDGHGERLFQLIYATWKEWLRNIAGADTRLSKTTLRG